MRALLLRPPLLPRLPLREEERLLDLREDLRAPPFLRDEDFRAPRERDDFRAPPELRLLERFLAPPRLRPEDPARFLPPLERLDFLAAAMGMLHVRGFVHPIARFAHNKDATVCGRETRRHERADHFSLRVSPWRIIQSRSGWKPAVCHAERIRTGGSSIGSSVSLNVPQWEAATMIGLRG